MRVDFYFLLACIVESILVMFLVIKLNIFYQQQIRVQCFLVFSPLSKANVHFLADDDPESEVGFCFLTDGDPERVVGLRR